MSESSRSFFDRLRREDSEYSEAWEQVEDAVTLAKNIIRRRRGLDLTQKDLARRSGMRQPRIAELEAGQSNPTLHTLRRVAAALGTNPSQLLAPERTAQTVVHKYAIFEPHGHSRVNRHQNALPQQFSVGGSLDELMVGWFELEEIFE